MASAAAIAAGLGEPSLAISSSDLREVATVLVSCAGTATPEDIAKAARLARARLDTDSVEDLEEHRRSRRTLSWFETADGMTRLHALLDPESAAIITGALATALSPRRGGPRFVDPAEVQRAQDMLDDPRSNDQLAVDTLVETVQLATRAAGATAMFGQKSPAVRVHVQAEALQSGRGFAYFEGQSAVVSISIAERHLCLSGILPILFDGHTRSTQDAPNGPIAPDNALLSPRNRTAAPGTTATGHPNSPRCTTSIPSTGPTPPLPTGSASAGSTTCNSTPTTGPSRNDPTEATGPHHHPGSPDYPDNPDYTPSPHSCTPKAHSSRPDKPAHIRGIVRRQQEEQGEQLSSG